MRLPVLAVAPVPTTRSTCVKFARGGVRLVGVKPAPESGLELLVQPAHIKAIADSKTRKPGERMPDYDNGQRPFVSSDRIRPSPATLLGIGCLSGAVLMVELALTRIFSVTMYYHFAFLAVSIPMLGLTADRVFVFVTPRWHAPDRARAQLRRYATLLWLAIVFDAVVLLRLRVGVEYSPENAARLIAV